MNYDDSSIMMIDDESFLVIKNDVDEFGVGGL